MGDQFPDVKSLSVHNVELDKDEQRIENLDLLLDINYVGNFTTSIDADMVLGKKGSITLRGECVGDREWVLIVPTTSLARI